MSRSAIENERLAVGLHRGLGRRRLDQAEDLASGLVVPVAQIGHAVLGTDLHVASVRIGDGGAGQSGNVLVLVQEEWHSEEPPNRAAWRANHRCTREHVLSPLRHSSCRPSATIPS